MGGKTLSVHLSIHTQIRLTFFWEKKKIYVNAAASFARRRQHVV